MYSLAFISMSIWSWFLYMVWSRGPISFFGMWIDSCPRKECWKEYSFPPLNCFGTLVENKLTINILAYFWSLNSIYWFTCLSLCNTTLSWLLYLGGKFEIKKCKSFNCVVHFQDWLFRVSCYSTWILESACEFLQRNSDKDCAQSIDRFEEFCLSTILLL